MTMLRQPGNFVGDQLRVDPEEIFMVRKCLNLGVHESCDVYFIRWEGQQVCCVNGGTGATVRQPAHIKMLCGPMKEGLCVRGDSRPQVVIPLMLMPGWDQDRPVKT